eukprot:scaffold65927_cov61-Phaeocystis_antarctica.AAC.3
MSPGLFKVVADVHRVGLASLAQVVMADTILGRLFACCTSAKGDSAKDENGSHTSQAMPAITKVNDMPLARVAQQKDRDTEEGLSPEQTGDEYDELVAEGSRCAFREDWRVAAKAFREAIALRPDELLAYLKLGMALGNSSWHDVDAAQLFLLRRSSKEQLGAPARPFEAATSGCDGFLIDLDGTMYQPGGLLLGAREFYRWIIDSGTCHMHMQMHIWRRARKRARVVYPVCECENVHYGVPHDPSAAPRARGPRITISGVMI